MVEGLGYSAESHSKVMSSRLALPCEDWKTLSSQP